MNPKLVADLCAVMKTGEAVEIRTIDGKTYIAAEAKVTVFNSIKANGGIETYGVVGITHPKGDQATFIACEHIAVLNFVRDPKALYGAPIAEADLDRIQV